MWFSSLLLSAGSIEVFAGAPACPGAAVPNGAETLFGLHAGMATSLVGPPAQQPWTCEPMQWILKPTIFDKNKLNERQKQLCSKGCDNGLFETAGRSVCRTHLGAGTKPLQISEAALLTGAARMIPNPSLRLLASIPPNSNREHTIQSRYEERNGPGVIIATNHVKITTGPNSELRMHVSSKSLDTSKANGMATRATEIKYTFSIERDPQNPGEYVIEYSGSVAADSPYGSLALKLGGGLVGVKGKTIKGFEDYRNKGMQALTGMIQGQR